MPIAHGSRVGGGAKLHVRELGRIPDAPAILFYPRMVASTIFCWVEAGRQAPWRNRLFTSWLWTFEVPTASPTPPLDAAELHDRRPCGADDHRRRELVRSDWLRRCWWGLVLRRRWSSATTLRKYGEAFGLRRSSLLGVAPRRRGHRARAWFGPYDRPQASWITPPGALLRRIRRSPWLGDTSLRSPSVLVRPRFTGLRECLSW